MGNQNCSEIYQDRQQNQSYGDFKIIKEANKNIAYIQKALEKDQQLIQEVKEKLQVRLKLKSNHLVKLQKYDIQSNKYSTQIKMYYEFIPKTLQHRAKQKIAQNTQFTERELFNIIYGVQDALQELKKYDITHGCINLTTVLCQTNFYKITDVSSTTFVKSYELVRRGCRDQFLSPKLLTNLEYRSLEPYYEIEDDLFSLGMIILCLTSKTDSKYFYNWKEKQCTAQIRWENVQNSIKKIERTYSSKLSKKVKQLIGFGQELNKSIQTNSTTVNNGNNMTKHMNSNQLGQITESINELDKDIERILSRVKITTFVPNSLSKETQKRVNQYDKFKQLESFGNLNDLSSFQNISSSFNYQQKDDTSKIYTRINHNQRQEESLQ